MQYLKTYQAWVDNLDLDPVLKQELQTLSQSDIKESFYQNLSFGTGGLRGLMGVGTNRVNLYTIRKATLGFGRYLLENKETNGVAIAYDNRHDSARFALETAKVLAALGIKSYLFKNLRPTPMLSFAVRYFKASGGVMITASHNPKAYNGYKVYNASGAQLNLEEAEAVIEQISQIDDLFSIEAVENDLIQYIDQDFDQIYLNLVKDVSVQNTSKPLKIVFSPLHGTGGTVIPQFLKQEGYDVYPYVPQMTTDPNFSATLSSNPEEENAYIETINYAKSVGAELILVTDPDADRLGVAVLKDGTYQLLSGNQTAAIELYYLSTEKKRLGRLPKNSYVFTTNVTTDLIPVLAQDFGFNLKTTLTGFKFIGEQAKEIEGKGTYFFGCEESYGSLILDFVRDKDAVQAVYLLAEIANVVFSRGQTLVDYLEEIYQKYGYFYEYTLNVTLAGIKGSGHIQDIMTYYRSNPPVIPGFKFLGYDDIASGISSKDGKEQPIGLPKSNVIKYYFEQNTWIVFRPSGTEPKIKIYFGTKSTSLEQAKIFVDGLVQEIKETIGKITK